jgi:glycine/D-amino acid oxidase-like deaminating enzyme
MVHSLWADTAEPAPASNKLLGETRADVVIVGGGYTGLRAALDLAEAGTNVIVLEAMEIGWGASGRNGGQVNPLLPENTPESVASKIGNEAAEKTVDAALGFADELFSLVDRYDINCGARQNGWLRVAHCSTAARNWRLQCESWAKAGAQIDIVEGQRLAELTGSVKFEMGALVGSGGAIQPLSFVRGLAKCAEVAGARIYSETPAISLANRNAVWSVTTPYGSISAESVVLCTNGYSNKLWPGLARSIVPLTAVQVATDPLPDKVRSSILPGGQTLSDTRRTILYGRIESTGHFVLGSIGQAGDGWPIDFRRLPNEANRIFPQLSSANWRYQWGGRIAITEDHLPHLHEPAQGLHIGLGYNGRAVAMSNVMGRVLAERVLGSESREAPFPVTSIKHYPLGQFSGCGAPFVIAYMGLCDWLDRVRG